MAARRESVLLAALLVACAGGCRVGPRYERPTIDVPAEYRGFEEDTTEAGSLGDRRWSEIFRDDSLRALIARALIANEDVHIAAARVLQAEAQVTITRADQFPTVTAEATTTVQRTPATVDAGVSLPAFTAELFRLGMSVSWEADFWEKVRSATEAQRAALLGARWAERAVSVSVVSLVAQDYFTLRELDLTLDIAHRTLAARQESLRLTRTLEAAGSVSMLDVRQAEQLVYTAESVITDTERLIAQQENAISILLGRNPGPIPRGTPLANESEPTEVPPGLPSRLLERRPDIRQAEFALVGANAQIGVARAALYPQITLTAAGGFQSQALGALFSGPAEFWNIGGDLLQQIFNAGKLKAEVRLSEAQKLELVFAYRRTIQQAFREVSDALVGFQRTRQLREQLTQLVASTQDAVRLSDIRYRGGAASYLEVLTSQASAFDAELHLAQGRLNELLALVALYAGRWLGAVRSPIVHLSACADRSSHLHGRPLNSGASGRRGSVACARQGQPIDSTSSAMPRIPQHGVSDDSTAVPSCVRARRVAHSRALRPRGVG
jgi:outer membrane protein, multidrug efflux system